MSEPDFVIGIDLGTSNTSVSFAPAPHDGSDEVGDIEGVALPQLVDVGVVESRHLLPSFLYLPAAAALPEGALDLPWESDPGFVVGAFARDHGGKVPDRLVASAKSWLCHTGVDRTAPILPWGKPAEAHEIPRISPVAASARYLEHVRRAWDYAFGDAAGALEDQEVVLTVPASFDAVARDLTVTAARAAGIAQPVLLEEPQAALYAWLDAHGDGWRDELSVGDRVLICDIGGGTTDFSLIAISEQGGELVLERVAVGDHILLGGDNMDYALAYAVKVHFERAGTKLEAWQVRALLQSVRAAKEDLLSPDAPQARTVVVPTRGSRLVGGTLRLDVSREQVLRVVREGFFPRCEASERPRVGRRAGLSQIGLQYASDAGVTRHLAHFLTRAAQEDGEPGRRFVHPTAILFNGGVMQSAPLRERLVETLNGWLAEDGGAPVKVLGGSELDVAVSRGAVYYGQVRRGHGVRIRGGTARTYYVGVEQPMPAIPGFEPPMSAVCVAPFGMEEGTALALPDEVFGLAVGEPVQFRFFASSVRRHDPIGHALDEWTDEDELVELPPIEAELAATEGGAGGFVQVGLESAVTATGTLELHCVAGDGRRWRLAFDVRHPDASGEAPPELPPDAAWTLD